MKFPEYEGKLARMLTKVSKNQSVTMHKLGFLFEGIQNKESHWVHKTNYHIKYVVRSDSAIKAEYVIANVHREGYVTGRKDLQTETLRMLVRLGLPLPSPA